MATYTVLQFFRGHVRVDSGLVPEDHQ